MRSKGYILFAFRLLFSLLMLGTFLYKGMPEKQWHAEKQSGSGESKDQQEASFQQYRSSYLIPSVVFHFDGDFTWLSPSDFCITWVENLCKTATKPIFRLSFFEKLFEHHIAINAP